MTVGRTFRPEPESDAFFGTDFFICSQHHGMLREPVDQHQINVFSGGGDLYFYMGKICLMFFAFIRKEGFYLTLALIPQLCYRDPSPMKEKFALRSQADDVILFQFVKLKERLIIIVSSVHDKGSFAKEYGTAFHCGKGDIIDGGEVLLFRRMEL